MTLKLVQAGQGSPRNIAFFFLVDAAIMGEKLKAALGSDTCIITDADSHGIESSQALVAKAKALGGFGEVAGVAYVGYSNGGQRVRNLLQAGADPCAVVIIDGTHDTIPASHLDVWRTYRAGGKLFVATCTQQTYTDDLPAGRFLCTRHTLEQAFDLTLPPNAEAHDGNLHVHSYPSARIDGPAHIAQAQVTMPEMCAKYLAPWLAGWLKPAPRYESVPPPEQPWEDRSASFGERCCRFALAEMAAGVREDPPGSNTSPRIREYFAPATRRATGKPLGLTGGAWCAAFACFTQRMALLPGEAGAHGYYISGLELQQSAEVVRTWRPRSYVPKRGDLCILKRGGNGWERHVCRVLDVDDHGGVLTIGGNENNAIGRAYRQLDDDTIVGWICVP